MHISVNNHLCLLQKKLSGFHRTAAEQMLNGLSAAHSAALASASAAASSGSGSGGQARVHSTTTNGQQHVRTSHEDDDLSDMSDMDDEDIDIDDDLEPTGPGMQAAMHHHHHPNLHVGGPMGSVGGPLPRTTLPPRPPGAPLIAALAKTKADITVSNPMLYVVDFLFPFQP